MSRSTTAHGSAAPDSVERARTRSSRDEADPERSGPPPRREARGPEENAPPPAEEITPLRFAAHYAGLVLASMIGCLIRLGLDAIGEYDGRVVFPLAWSQGVGTGIMGLAMARKNEIVAVYPPLYTFITTGIAGSVTTFSSWMLEGYQSFANFDDYPRSGFYDTVDGFAYSFSTFLIALAALHVGAHFSAILPALPRPASSPRPVIPDTKDEAHNGRSAHPRSRQVQTPHRLLRSQHPLLDVLTVVSAILSYLIALLLYFLAPATWRHRATFPILLAPPGAILRFALARLNVRAPFLDRFPIGTFIANITATLLIAGAFAAQRLPSAGSGVRCNALVAIQQGFCGCLSTVSTFVVESRSIKRNRCKWIYVGGSVVLGHICVLAVVGGVGWTQGYGAVCSA